ncbi:MAG: 50S ribosomal protein L9 [gamma proteobacterium symbiont of Bathyaustriella thionipta]|nr:50S ribosomal protein L9 [gamma proteobacterium symbiont of Bathyaustriella thionipta]
MDVILLKKVENLGGLGDKVAVKAGYGRNFLIPSGTAVPATRENLEEFEKRRAEYEKQAAELLSAAQSRKDQITALSRIIVACKAGDEGRLFGSVGTHDIAEAMNAAGVSVDKHEVRLPDGAFRQVGTFEVALHLHTDINASIELEIVPED